jgi:hypothetical protein
MTGESVPVQYVSILVTKRCFIHEAGAKAPNEQKSVPVRFSATTHAN